MLFCPLCVCVCWLVCGALSQRQQQQQQCQQQQVAPTKRTSLSTYTKTIRIHVSVCVCARKSDYLHVCVCVYVRRWSCGSRCSRRCRRRRRRCGDFDLANEPVDQSSVVCCKPSDKVFVVVARTQAHTNTNTHAHQYLRTPARKPSCAEPIVIVTRSCTSCARLIALHSEPHSHSLAVTRSVRFVLNRAEEQKRKKNQANYKNTLNVFT